MSLSNTAYIQKIEKLGTFDGPGIRTVFFLSGCPLRCLYCHNPETWKANQGQTISVEEVLRIARRNKNYYGLKGGITLSGGEPLMQADFVLQCFKALKAEGFHTVLDTSGHSSSPLIDLILDYTDLVLYDLKAADKDMYHSITLGQKDITDAFLKKTQDHDCKLWIRQVLVPGINDNVVNLEQSAQVIAKLNNVERIEVLPYHTLGLAKYEKMNIEYPLKGLKPMDMIQAEEFQTKLNVRIAQLKKAHQ